MIRLTIIGLALSLTSFSRAASYGGGSGTAGDPFLIYTPDQLNTIGANPSDWGRCFKLMETIDMSGYTGTQYRIIGTSNTPFTGTFDGNGYAISNLTYSTTAVVMYVGLFGYTNNATILNLGVENMNLHTGGSYAGGLVAWQESGLIVHCYSTGTVTASASSTYVGGVVGRSSGTITCCFSTGSIAASSTFAAAYAGGLVGFLTSNILSSCYSTASVSASSSSNSYAGGLVGLQTSSTIASCYSTGPIIASSSTAYIGGLLGFQGANTRLEKCYSIGTVSATAMTLYQGGLVGYQAGSVSNCFWDWQISSQLISAGGTAKTTLDMQTLSTFISAGWDFTNETLNGTHDYWRMCTDGIGYPRLNWELTDGDFACPDGVTIEDLGCYAGNWLKQDCSSVNHYCGGIDLNYSGFVDLADWAVFAGNWLSQ